MLSAELKERNSTAGKSDVMELVFSYSRAAELPAYEKAFTVNGFFSSAGIRLYLNIFFQKLYSRVCKKLLYCMRCIGTDDIESLFYITV